MIIDDKIRDEELQYHFNREASLSPGKTDKHGYLEVKKCYLLVKVIRISSIFFKGEIIPSIHANPTRFLGRTIDFTVSDKHFIEKFVTEVSTGLQFIDKSSHKGIYKLWI